MFILDNKLSKQLEKAKSKEKIKEDQEVTLMSRISLSDVYINHVSNEI